MPIYSMTGPAARSTPREALFDRALQNVEPLMRVLNQYPPEARLTILQMAMETIREGGGARVLQRYEALRAAGYDPNLAMLRAAAAETAASAATLMDLAAAGWKPTLPKPRPAPRALQGLGSMGDVWAQGGLDAANAASGSLANTVCSDRMAQEWEDLGRRTGGSGTGGSVGRVGGAVVGGAACALAQEGAQWVDAQAQANRTRDYLQMTGAELTRGRESLKGRFVGAFKAHYPRIFQQAASGVYAPDRAGCKVGFRAAVSAWVIDWVKQNFPPDFLPETARCTRQPCPSGRLRSNSPWAQWADQAEKEVRGAAPDACLELPDTRPEGVGGKVPRALSGVFNADEWDALGRPAQQEATNLLQTQGLGAVCRKYRALCGLATSTCGASGVCADYLTGPGAGHGAGTGTNRRYPPRRTTTSSDKLKKALPWVAGGVAVVGAAAIALT